MGTANHPAPAMDEECAAAWRHVVDNQFGGRLPEITEEIVPRARMHRLPTREMGLSALSWNV
ncbi:hypothetical protein MXD63_24975 [Frankia sp. Cpl3]|nr:hypothetical protein [Frankia sp. Cpl3]